MNRIMKRGIIALAIMLLLAADTAITLRLAGHESPRAASAPAYSEARKDPMDAFRLEREQLRARQEAQLNDIIHTDGTDARIVADAQTQLMGLLARSESETALEGILGARGFGEVLVSVSEGAANVLVRKEALTAAESAVILDLVMRQTGLTGGNVKIIPVK